MFIGEIISRAIRFILQNPLTVFNTILLLITGYLSYSAFIFQRRTGIRESLEQLEDVEFRNEKLRPILHQFTYSMFGDSKSTVYLMYYRLGTNSATANQPQNLFHNLLHKYRRVQSSDFEMTDPEFHTALALLIEDHEGISEADVLSNGILIEMDTGNAVKVRRTTEEVLQILWGTLMDSGENVESNLQDYLSDEESPQ